MSTPDLPLRMKQLKLYGMAAQWPELLAKAETIAADLGFAGGADPVALDADSVSRVGAEVIARAHPALNWQVQFAHARNGRVRPAVCARPPARHRAPGRAPRSGVPPPDRSPRGRGRVAWAASGSRSCIPGAPDSDWMRRKRRCAARTCPGSRPSWSSAALRDRCC